MGIRFISSLFNKRTLHLITVVLALSGYPAVYAVEIIAEDVSNKVVSCDSPLLEGKPPGTCIAIPDGTLSITVTLEEGDNPDILDNMHIAIHSEGRNYQYQPKSTSSELWGEIPEEHLQGKILLTDSIPPFSFETHSVGRQIHLGRFASIPGTKVYVGVRANYESGFMPGMIQKVFEVP